MNEDKRKENEKRRTPPLWFTILTEADIKKHMAFLPEFGHLHRCLRDRFIKTFERKEEE